MQIRSRRLAALDDRETGFLIEVVAVLVIIIDSAREYRITALTLLTFEVDSIEILGIGEVFEDEMKEFKRIARRVDKQRKHERDEYGVEFTPFEDDPEAIKREFELAGEVYMGHLRYGTSGEFDEGSCHPYLRRSNWPTRTLMFGNALPVERPAPRED